MAVVVERRAMAPGLTRLGTAWHATTRLPTAMTISALVVAVYAICAIFAPWIAPYDPTDQDFMAAMMGPSAEHWLGADSFGRDLLSRSIHGARLAFVTGIGSVALGAAGGAVIGLFAGLMGGRVEWILMRFVDGLLALPSLIMAIAFMALLGLGVENVIMAIGVSFMAPFARTVRADVLQIKTHAFIEAAGLMGASNTLIIRRHILPNVIFPIIVQAGMRVSEAILLSAGLSFLGIGVAPPTPDWGLMISDGRQFITFSAWITGVPGMALAVILIALNVLGDGLRQIYDPNVSNS